MIERFKRSGQKRPVALIEVRTGTNARGLPGRTASAIPVAVDGPEVRGAAITGRGQGSVDMSHEIVKWRPSNTGRKIDEAIAEIRRCEIRKAEPAEIRQRQPEKFGNGTPGEVLDLPRVCAIHDKPWSARYIRGRNGHFHYAQTVRVTEALYLSQYAECGNARQDLPVNDLGDETCPWCGASGFGAVRCGGCKRDVCYGRTVSGYFRCRPSCGHEGKIVRSNYRVAGISPFSGAGSFSVGG